MKPAVLILSCWQYPGLESSGPNRSLDGILQFLSNDFDFFVVGLDRGHDDLGPRDVEHCWQAVGSAKRLRLARDETLGRRLRAVLNDTNHDLLMLNSFFDPVLTNRALILRKLQRIPIKPTTLSVHGEFSPGALQLGMLKKSLYVRFVKWQSLLKSIWLHATGIDERDQIAQASLGARGVILAPNISPMSSLPHAVESDVLRIVYISRIARMKNLDFAIRVLNGVSNPVIFRIYGPVSDAKYNEECRAMIRTLPPHVQVEFMGEIAHKDVPETFAANDLFFLPTLGENFGYAIHESLLSGTPVLISDRTPWRGLQACGAGWDIPLSDPRRFSETIDALAATPSNERRRLRDGARALAEKCWRESDAVDATRGMFRQVLAAGP
jgi:glycosyltransferase involved in cell wall biosynthesis